MIGYTDKWTCMQLLFLPIPLDPWLKFFFYHGSGGTGKSNINGKRIVG